MTSHITILRHATNRMAKLWQADGSIEPYGDGKFFTLREQPVDSILALSSLLTTLERDSRACVIRGKYRGDEHAAAVDPERQAGRVRRILDLYDDAPLHWLLVEVDNFEPLVADPILEPVDAINEFITCALPEAFHGAGYHWQLSNSAGHSKNAGKLKVHLWFWLATPQTSAVLRAWASALQLPIDKAVFNAVQVHYTSAPLFDDSLVDPVPVRSGFVEGLLGDEVPLVIDEAVLASARDAGKPTRLQRLAEAASADPVVNALYDRGMVKSVGKQGELRIVCPRASEHTGESAETATLYYLAHTGGFERGTFACLHDHCRGVAQSVFLEALGVDTVSGDFADLTRAEPVRAAESGEAVKVIPKTIPEAQHLVTDQANANRVMRHFKTRLIVTTDRWFAWTGTHWAQDEGEVYRCALSLSRIIKNEANQWRAKKANDIEAKEKNEKIADALDTWGKKSEMKSTIDAAMHLAKRMLAVSSDLIDRDPWALNCLNGTVDLRTGKLRPHHPDDYITKVIPLEYDPAARAPLFEGTLAKVTMEEGMTTRPLASFLQRWFGYCATASTREQKFVVHYGRGRNGKSTVLDLVSDVLGDYAATAAPGLLVSDNKDRHPTEVADLFGRRMVTAHESKENGVLREEFVKHATGSDKIKARFMRADFFEFVPTHKIQLLTNYKPIIKGQDEGIWRRVLLVPYLARFGTPEELSAGLATHLRDTGIADALAREKGGVLRWLVAGAVDWFRDGLNPPDAVLAASKDYQHEQDRLLQFVMECCELGYDKQEPLVGEMGGLFPAYQDWCKESGYFALSKMKFLQELERTVPHMQKISSKQKTASDGRRKVVIIRGLQLLAS